MDLSIIFYWKVAESASITVNNAILSIWNVTKEQLLDIAEKNMESDISFANMENVIREIFLENENDDMEIPECSLPLFVLTNHDNLYGASLLICEKCINRISKILKGDVVILPSSVHEVIIVPWDKSVEVDKLKTMVSEVNNTQLSNEEILSYNVYGYKAEDKKVSIL